MTKRLMLALAIATGAAAANAATPRQAAAEGNWDYVCCGPQCPIGDRCSGNGIYACCKDE